MIDELLSGLGGGVFRAHVPCHMDTHTLLHFPSVTAQVRRENERRDEVLLCTVRRQVGSMLTVLIHDQLVSQCHEIYQYCGPFSSVPEKLFMEQNLRLKGGFNQLITIWTTFTSTHGQFQWKETSAFHCRTQQNPYS